MNRKIDDESFKDGMVFGGILVFILCMSATLLIFIPDARQDVIKEYESNPHLCYFPDEVNKYVKESDQLHDLKSCIYENKTIAYDKETHTILGCIEDWKFFNDYMFIPINDYDYTPVKTKTFNITDCQDCNCYYENGGKGYCNDTTGIPELAYYVIEYPENFSYKKYDDCVNVGEANPWSLKCTMSDNSSLHEDDYLLYKLPMSYEEHVDLIENYGVNCTPCFNDLDD